MEPKLLEAKKSLQDRREGRYRSILRWTWRLIYGSVLAVAALFLFINFTAIPSFRELEDPASSQASEVLASNGQTLGRYYIENRVPVSYEQLSPWLVKALIATEDERFTEHAGIDPQAVGRVVAKTILMSDQSSGGGSTITQQLAKMLYSDRNFEGMGKAQKTFALIYRKLREWLTAIRLERAYTKEEIVAMYLNQFNFINGAYGIRAASEIYFGKSQDKLTIEEAAMLIGMLQNPSRYNPLRFPESCIKRRMVVLKQMQQNGYLTEDQYDQIKVKPLDMSKFRRAEHSDDKAPYLCMELRKDINKILALDECRKSDGSKYDIFRDGLKIYTSVDPTYQKYAEEAVSENMRKLQKRLFEVWKGRDPWRYKIAATSSKDEGTTDEEIELRIQSLQNDIRDCDRYLSLRPKYLGPVLSKIEDEFNIALRDDQIDLMLAEEKKAGAISKKVAKNWVTPDQASLFRRILKSQNWATLKTAWRALDTAADREMAQKRPMRVFAWNKKMQTDTSLSPLDSIKYHKMFLQTGLLAVDPTTAKVKAWVGGIDYKYFQYDHVRTDRQVGSTFKPFVYATAMAQQGLSPCYHVYDQPVTIPKAYQNFKNGQDWTPKNSKGSYSWRLMTLKEALKHSVNSVSAYLMKQMGDTEPVRGLVHNMGIDSSARRGSEYRIPKQPAICLGAADLSVWEMTEAYATFANNGIHARPTVIEKIEDKNGRIIWRAEVRENPALPPNYNFAMVQMLKNNVKGASGFGVIRSEVGGKTGTTNDYTDGWFMGVTPKLVVGTWVGGEERWVRFLTLDDGQGAKMARPIFVSMLSKLEKDAASGYDATAKFAVPPGDLGFDINCGGFVRDSTSGPSGDDFSPDRFEDEEGASPSAPKDRPGNQLKQPAARPADQFGDERINGGQ